MCLTESRAAMFVVYLLSSSLLLIDTITSLFLHITAGRTCICATPDELEHVKLMGWGRSIVMVVFVLLWHSKTKAKHFSCGHWRRLGSERLSVSSLTHLPLLWHIRTTMNPSCTSPGTRVALLDPAGSDVLVSGRTQLTITDENAQTIGGHEATACYTDLRATSASLPVFGLLWTPWLQLPPLLQYDLLPEEAQLIGRTASIPAEITLWLIRLPPKYLHVYDASSPLCLSPVYSIHWQ